MFCTFLIIYSQNLSFDVCVINYKSLVKLNIYSDSSHKNIDILIQNYIYI